MATPALNHGQQIAHARCVLLAKTILRLGGSASVARLSQMLDVSPATIQARLSGNSERQVSGAPQWLYFVHCPVTGEWTLTTMGLVLAEEQLEIEDPFAKEESVPKQPLQRVGAHKVQCGICKARRFVTPERFKKILSQSSTKQRQQMRLCKDCSDKQPADRVPDTAGVVMGDCRLPTQAQPGSPMKIAILTERARLIEKGKWKGPLHLKGDAGIAGKTLFERILGEAA